MSRVVNVGPILAPLGGWLLQEAFPARVLAGMLVSFAGAAVVGISTSDNESGSTLGVLLCLVAAMSYVSGVICQKPALRHASPLQVTTFGCMIGAAACLPFTGQSLSQLGNAPLGATAKRRLPGVLPTALACTTWAYALARTTAGKMGAATHIVPHTGGTHVVGDARRGTWVVDARRRGAVPGRRCRLPDPATQSHTRAGGRNELAIVTLEANTVTLEANTAMWAANTVRCGPRPGPRGE